jgi:hypothetical protein
LALLGILPLAVTSDATGPCFISDYGALPDVGASERPSSIEEGAYRSGSYAGVCPPSREAISTGDTRRSTVVIIAQIEAGMDGSQRSGVEVAFCAPEKLETLTQPQTLLATAWPDRWNPYSF